RGDRAGDLIGWTLVALALGLVPFSLQYILSRAYFSVEDTRSVFYFELVIACTLVATAWLLVRVGHASPNWIAPCLGLANTMSFVVGLGVTLWHIRRAIPVVRVAPILRLCVRTTIAALPGAGLAFLIVWLQTRRWDSLFSDILGLVAALLAGIGVYLGLAKVLRIQEIDQVVGLVTSRLGRRPASGAKEDSMAVVNPPRPDGTIPDPPPRPADRGFPGGQGATADPLLPPTPATPSAPAAFPPFPDFSEPAPRVPAPRVPGSPVPGSPGADPRVSDPRVADPRVADPGVPDPLAPDRRVPVPSERDPLVPHPPQPVPGSPAPGSPAPGAHVPGPHPPDPHLPGPHVPGAPVPGAHVPGSHVPDLSGDEDGNRESGARPGGARSAQTPGRSTAAASLRADAPEQPILSGFTPIIAGQLLNGRYRLVRQLGRERHASRWRAQDEVLGRAVLVHALEDEETADAVIQAARQSTAATDARFVRVLDAVADPEGFYVISEWVEGTPLAQVLQAGPLSAIESAWVAKEVAESLTTIHPLRVYHLRLDPTRVLVTQAGDIRIAGLGTAAALNSGPDDADLTRAQSEQRDVYDLGRILYACQTGAWPGPEDVGLPMAPRGASSYLMPQMVQPAASGALDRLTDQLLSDQPRGGQPPITSAAGALRALSHVLGSADSSADLAHRLVLAANSPAVTPPWAAEPPPAPEALTEPAPPPAEDEVAPARDEGSGTELAQRRPWSIGLVLLAALIVVALLTVLVVKLFNSSGEGGPDESATPDTSASVTGLETVPVAQAWTFDPFGSNTENDDDIPLAHDGDSATAWLTEAYPTATFTDAAQQPKPGVGYVVDLGQTIPIKQVWLTLANSATPLTVYATEPAAENANFSGLDGWVAVGESATVGPVTEPPTNSNLVVDAACSTRFVMVFFHDALPPDGKGEYQTGIAEILIVK
ncbi:MAG: hypothetical protein LBS56_07895, partial [Propionibacteriaceae bacterium]|nr:hypothetical protein [Propionibacteriaceae bacterium]